MNAYYKGLIAELSQGWFPLKGNKLVGQCLMQITGSVAIFAVSIVILLQYTFEFIADYEKGIVTVFLIGIFIFSNARLTALEKDYRYNKEWDSFKWV